MCAWSVNCGGEAAADEAGVTGENMYKEFESLPVGVGADGCAPEVSDLPLSCYPRWCSLFCVLA